MAVERQSSIHLTPALLGQLTHGSWVNYDSALRYNGICSHGAISPGNLSFAVALNIWRKRGVDIEHELLKILRKGASTVVVDRLEYATYFNRPMLIVEDVNKALEQVAVAIRDSIPCQRVLVAGSVGKTGFKTQLKHVLNPIKKTHAVINSANVKLPILYSLCSMQTDDEISIIEVSGAARYEIGVQRSTLVKPNIVVFTNVCPNHMRVHKSVENFIGAKASAVVGMEDNGVCIVNRDSELYDELVNTITNFRSDVRILTYGDSVGDAHVIDKHFDAKKLRWTITSKILGQTVEYTTPLFQSHAPAQSTGVLLTASVLGLDAQQVANNYPGLIPYETMGRIFRISTPEKSFLYYDQSQRGAIAGFRSAFEDLGRLKQGGRLIAVIGGSDTEVDTALTRERHEDLAVLVNNSGIDKLYTCGPFLDYMFAKLSREFSAKHIMHSDEKDKIFRELSKDIRQEDLIFVMGPRSLKLAQLSLSIFKLGRRTLLC